MSSEKRKKKAGQRKDKKNKRMREAVKERHENAQPKAEYHKDQGDVLYQKKRGVNLEVSGGPSRQAR